MSVALHAPLVLQERLGEVWDERGNIAYVTKESTKSVLNGHPFKKSKYVDELKEALEKGEHIDLGEFYLKSQYLDGRLEEDHMRQALDELASVEADVRVDKDKLETLDVLSGIRDRDGKHDEAHSYLSTVVLEGKGNCKARERFSAALVDRVFPDMEIVYQKVKLDGVRHTRTLVKVDGQWRNMEDPKGLPLSEADLAGTVLYEKYDYVKHYVDQGNLGNYKKPPVAINSHTEFLVTDDYLGVPLPDGVDFDNIKNVGSGSGTGGMGVGSVGQGAFGSPAPTGGNGQVDILVDGFVRDPIELEIFTAHDIEKNRQRTQATLKYWRELDAADASEIKKTLNTILPKMNNTCANELSLMLTVGAEKVLESCKLHETSGLLSCEYGLPYGIIPPGAVARDYSDLSCLPINLANCSSYKKNDLFAVDDYLRLVFVFALEYKFRDDLIGEISTKEEVRRVALELGILVPWAYEKLVELVHHNGYRFVGVANGVANFKGPNGESGSFSTGITFDDFYCQAE